MAYHEMPQIDGPSINSDLSAVKLRTYLNQFSGFIAREDVPDKGCDFDIELILDNKDVSNWRFALQLKSVQTLKTVEDGKYVSYPFETSRLGYLMRRIPGMGILALYSVEQDRIFYELVENIYQRISNERNGDQWKEQDSINVKLPIGNVLDKNSTAALHTIFTNRFQNAALMFQSHAANYNLPAVDIGVNIDEDLNSTEGIIQALKKNGIALMSTYDIQIVYSLITKLSMQDINTSKELQIIAALAYCEAGNHVEAGYYFDKLGKRTDIELLEQPMIGFSKHKNDFALGKINFKQFTEQCEKLFSPDKSSLNDIVLNINLHYAQLLTLKPLVEIPTELFDAIVDNFQKIEKAEGDSKVKALLKIWNADNFSLLIGHSRSKAFSKTKLAEAMNMPLSTEERGIEVRRQITMERLLDGWLEKLKLQADETSDDLLHANIILTLSRHRLSLELDLIAFHVNPSIPDAEIRSQMNHYVEQSKIGFQILNNEKRYKEAYQSLCNAIEFITLATEYYCLNEVFQLDDLQLIQKQLELELDFPPYQSAIRGLMNRVGAKPNNIPSVANYEFMSDEDINYAAGVVIERLGLPRERITNVILEMKSYRTFFQRCKDTSLEMFIYDPLRTKENRYESQTRYVIRSKKTELRTNASSDIESLLSFWRL